MSNDVNGISAEIFLNCLDSRLRPAETLHLETSQRSTSYRMARSMLVYEHRPSGTYFRFMGVVVTYSDIIREAARSGSH